MPCTKRPYLTEGHAQAACISETKSLTKRGAGAQAKYLEAYQCTHCGFWHLGRAWKTQRKAAQFVKPAPRPTLPRTGDLRRKLERMAREWQRKDDYQRRQRLAELGRLIAAEQATEKTQSELADIQRQITAMFLPAR